MGLFDIFFRSKKSAKKLARPAEGQKTAESIDINKLMKEKKTIREIRPRQTFVIADTYFSDNFIIKKRNRPYRTTHEMNDDMWYKWNELVNDYDTVYIIGIFATGDVAFFTRKLNGYKKFITEDTRFIGVKHSEIIEYEGVKFLLTSKPIENVQNFDGWIIYNHIPVSNVDELPSIDKELRRVNVSADSVDFQPVLMHDIVKTIIQLNPGYQTNEGTKSD